MSPKEDEAKKAEAKELRLGSLGLSDDGAAAVRSGGSSTGIYSDNECRPGDVV